MYGTVFVKNFKLSARVGCEDIERASYQELLVNISVVVEMTKAIETDELVHTVDYAEIITLAEELVKEKEYKLIETLADAIADISIRTQHAKRASVRIEKLNKFPTSDSVGIEIEKSK